MRYQVTYRDENKKAKQIVVEAEGKYAVADELPEGHLGVITLRRVSATIPTTAELLAAQEAEEESEGE